MKTADINGIAMAYHDEGSGQPLLFVHAFPLNSEMWVRQIAEFAPHGRVIVPDLRGFGETARGSGATSLDQHADDLAALLDHLGIQQTTVCGLSMGGYITFALWRRHRARIARLILADTRAGADTEEGKQGRLKNAQLAEAEGPGAIADQMMPKLMANSATNPLCDEARRMIESNDRAGIAAALRAMAARPDSTPLLAEIDVPTLVIVGSEDALTPPSESHAMHAAIANSRLVEVPGAGHLSNLENPEVFNAAIDDFLNPFRAMRATEPDNEFKAGGGLAGSW